MIHSRRLIVPYKNVKITRLGSIPVRFHRRHLDWLMFERVEAVLITDHQLQGSEDRRQADRHAQHGTAFLDVPAGHEVACANREYDEACREIGRVEHVRKSVRKTWIEDDLQPIGWVSDAIAHFVACR